jgi:hypothetical protein
LSNGFKENHVSNDPASTKIPEEALSAFLDGILTELKSPADPDMLTQVRAMFKKRIPFHLRSYAAALLILRAAGISRQPAAGKSAQLRSQAPSSSGSSTSSSTSTSTGTSPLSRRAGTKPRETRPAKGDAFKSDALKGGALKHDTVKHDSARQDTAMTPLFVSMGKRQRLRPQELRDLISEKTGIKTSDLGRVHLFDNYSFIDIPESEAARVIAAVNGSTLAGKVLEVKPAHKRNAPAASTQDASLSASAASAPDSATPDSSPSSSSTSASSSTSTKATNGDNTN